jgi:hypothetical protein
MDPTAIGTNDCHVQTDATVTCPNTDVSSLEHNDPFEVQALSHDGSGETLITTVNTVTDSHDFTINSTPPFPSDKIKIIDALFVDPANPGSGYSFGSSQDLQGGSPDVLLTGATPKLMTVVKVRVHTPGTGSDGTYTLTLNPAGYPNALSGVQASFLGTVSGAVLASISVTSGALYRGIDGSYPYDSSGWYRNIPVAGGNLTGATVDIQFGVVTEVISNSPNVYQSDSTHPMPCDQAATAASMFSHDNGTGLMVYCSSHNPLVSFGHDNLAAIEAVNDYESAQILAHTPVCVKFSGRFLSSAIDLAATPAHLIQGGPCLEGDAQILSGIFIFPAASRVGDMVIFPIVDANGNGSDGPVQAMVTDPNNYVKAGTFIANLTFWGDWSSPVVQNAIKFYGFAQWATVMNVSSWNVRGCLICVGVVPDQHGDEHGQIAESTFFNLRTEYTGDKATATPAFGLDGVGEGTDDFNSPNNDLILRYRTYDDNGVPLTIRPCTGGGTGYGAHELTVSELKVEESGMEYSPNATDAVQVGETSKGCHAILWGTSDGHTFQTSDTNSESGVHGLTFAAPNIVNLAVDTAAFHFKGCTDGDLENMRILGGAIASGGASNGLGMEFDVSHGGNVVDIVKNNTTDYNLIYSGTVGNSDCGSSGNVESGALEYDAHDQATAALIDLGINVMTTLRCALGQPLTACDGANGQLVDQNSAQTVANKTILISSLLISTIPPTIASGFGTAPSIIAANGSAAFQIRVGTGGTASSGTINLPVAAHGWDCKATDITTESAVVFLTKQTASAVNSATFANYTATGGVGPWLPSDKLNVSCHGF